MDIIRRNFFRLLRAGVLDEAGEMEPMSPYKWRRAADLLRAQHVVPLAAKGIQKHGADPRMNMPTDLRDALLQEAKILGAKDFDAEPRLSNPFLNNRLKRIRHNERHAIDTNIETLKLLDIIIANINYVMSNGLSLQGILQIGRYLRTKGQFVDFVKLDLWLHQLHVTRMASLLGSILVEVFEFDEDEVPFIKKMDPKANRLLMQALQVDQQSIQRNPLLFLFQPLESSTRFVRNIKKRLSEIEE